MRLASTICETPVALVSLVASDRQWFKARIGFEPCETETGSSVYAHALVEPDLLVITDLAKDPRSSQDPLVRGEPHIRFDAGAPLMENSGSTRSFDGRFDDRRPRWCFRVSYPVPSDAGWEPACQWDECRSQPLLTTTLAGIC